MNIHTIETYGQPWQNFLRRDHLGRIENERDDCRAANARLAARHDRKLMRLVRLGDVDGVRLRLCGLGIYSTSREATDLIEGAQ
ncbi:hypothetical protein [Ensifer sp. Root558]|uniref:hypothetical protein n=1 Tax=Ensifer sp. Root558 TaxID=1736558 RepID=UPI000713A1B5|nr:hypothetical protein [Ensifer sp. Root558]KQZ45400.1 hypothetical protein ASD63_09515 [Ensifer sp. Root558]